MRIIPCFDCFAHPDGVSVVSVRFREAGPGPCVPSELTLHDARELRDALEAASAPPGCWGLVIDLSGVEYLDSAVLGALIAAARRLRERGGGLAVCGASGFVRRAFEITRLCKVFVMADSVAQGRAGLIDARLSNPPLPTSNASRRAA